MFELEVSGKQADIQVKQAKAQKDMVESEAQAIENEVVKSGFGTLLQDQAADSALKQANAAQAQQKAIQTAVETQLLVSTPNPDKVAII